MNGFASKGGGTDEIEMDTSYCMSQGKSMTFTNVYLQKSQNAQDMVHVVNNSKELTHAYKMTTLGGSVIHPKFWLYDHKSALYSFHVDLVGENLRQLS